MLQADTEKSPYGALEKSALTGLINLEACLLGQSGWTGQENCGQKSGQKLRMDQ
jgi:hypothetical protein